MSDETIRLLRAHLLCMWKEEGGKKWDNQSCALDPAVLSWCFTAFMMSEQVATVIQQLKNVTRAINQYNQFPEHRPIQSSPSDNLQTAIFLPQQSSMEAAWLFCRQFKKCFSKPVLRKSNFFNWLYIFCRIKIFSGLETAV